MSYITSSLTVIIPLLLIRNITSYSQDYMYYPPKNYTRVIELKQGYIQGVVVNPNHGSALLTRVEHYRGIPYAAPPIGELRFMPPSGAPSWEGIKYADSFGPVCPQMFPDTENMAPQRLREFLRLKKYLSYQLEDCLYLNVYVPHNPKRERDVKYPVIFFIHGESYEWNSGNPYDGSVLAAYAKVVVVTFNFRLGILGFLKIDSGDGFNSNFGLVDQIAALLWVKDNIEAFGGDPSKVTLMGHGTGAVCANLLMQSPMIQLGNNSLCHRAILMGGTAIADWALASNPRDVTDQVARALECEVGDKACLRGKRLDEIMGAHVVTKPYSTRFGPIVDSSVVPNDPLKSMTNLSRFQLLFGVTEWESINMLGKDAILNGMVQKQRDKELLNYIGFTCHEIPELCRIYTGSYFENAETVRNTLLDILSDARTAAPMAKMALLHSSGTLHSYFYVFSHKTASKQYLRGKTTTGDELPYILGVPLDGSSFHFVDNYTEDEILFSKVIMTYIRNFAYRGNPNAFEYTQDEPEDDEEVIQKMQFWPEFNQKLQSYSLLDIPIATFSHYRANKLRFWNEVFPSTLENLAMQQKATRTTTTDPPPRRPKGTPPFIIRYPFNQENRETESSSTNERSERPIIFGNVVDEGTERPDTLNKVVYGTVINSEQNPSELQKATTMNIIVICGGLFLFINFFIIFVVYYKCYILKKRVTRTATDEVDGDVENAEKTNFFGDGQTFVANGGGLLKMISKSSKSDDVYEAVKLGTNTSKKNRLVRQLSSSTIDAHTKVRDWIANGVTSKISPKIPSKSKHNDGDKNVSIKNIDSILVKQDLNSESSTLGRSPTRPVSPAFLQSESTGKQKRVIIKQSSLNSSQDSKRRDKVSVAIDATPSGRGPSVLAQQPIELSKSLDLGASCSKPSLRRSATMEDFSPKYVDEIADLTKSVTSLISKPTIIKISHSHSKSDPVEDIYVSTKSKKLKTFDPEADVNVTSCDENMMNRPLSPEESLQTIKRRNFPKVLPDYPTKESLAQKRRSMPAPSLSIPINSLRNRIRLPPAPPVRTTSTLGRKPQPQPSTELVCNSAPVLLEENSSSPEPELTYNNLYVGPLIPKKKDNNDLLDTNPIYSSLSEMKKKPDNSSVEKIASPVAIVTTDPEKPIKKPEPKTVIRPKMVRQLSDPKSRAIPRVTATDNMPGHHYVPTKTDKDDSKLSKIVEGDGDRRNQRTQRPTLIPTPVKNQIVEKSNSSSETSPSEESDTGTVIAKKTTEI